MSTDSCLKLEEPCITIGLTCFNAEQTIGRALKSALSQDWPNLEVVVADDASSDSSWNIVEEFSVRDSRVKPIRHAVNLGAAGARNTIVAFFDDDDESLPERVRLQYETLREYEKASETDLIACYASGLRRYPNGYELHMPAIGSRPEVPKGEAVADYLLFNARRNGVFYGSGTPTCALMARLSTFRAESRGCRLRRQAGLGRWTCHRLPPAALSAALHRRVRQDAKQESGSGVAPDREALWLLEGPQSLLVCAGLVSDPVLPFQWPAA
jgi:glycosyltransferase involved in cell wall biosynthesis